MKPVHANNPATTMKWQLYCPVCGAAEVEQSVLLGENEDYDNEGSSGSTDPAPLTHPGGHCCP